MQIRKVKIEDTSNFLNMLLCLDKETTYMLFEPDERTKDSAKITNIIKESIDGSNLILVATADTDIIGFLSAQRGIQRRIRHSAYIVVGIRKNFRGQGIGKKLFAELNLWALENGISRLELTVLCKNDIAKHLYEKEGFIVEGIKRNSMIIDGKYTDEYYMAKLY